MVAVNIIVRPRARQRREVEASGSLLRSVEGEWYIVRARRVWRPPTDVYETDSHIVIKVEIAGMDKDGFDISLEDRSLIIAGRRKDPVGKLVYQNMEIRYGEFRSGIKVDWPVDEAAIEATYENGFLFVMLPKQTREQRIHVPVRDESVRQE